MASYENPWMYQGREFDDEDAEGYLGFVYRITSPTGKQYIGKKILSFSKRKKLKGKRVQRLRTPSDWKAYYGSSKALLADIELFGAQHFKREILVLCKTKGDMSWEESRRIILENALMRDDFYNDYLQCRINSRHLTKKS